MKEQELDAILGEIKDEVMRAVHNWPMPNPNLAKLAEESGEVAKCLVKENNWSRLKSECVQAAAMAIRVALEGDPGFPWSMK